MQLLPKKYHTSSNLPTVLFGTFNYCVNNTIQYNTIQYNTIQYNTIQYNTIQYLIYYKFPQAPFPFFSRLAQQILSYYDRAILPCSGIINHCCGVVTLFSCIVPLYTLFIPRRSCVNNLNSFYTRQCNGTINLSRFFGSQLIYGE